MWYWQRGLPAVGHISHDSDGNDPELAERLRVVCKELDIPTTWCILYPGGYAPSFYRRLRDEEFEVASHYDAVTGDLRRTWSYENFAIQTQWLRDMSGSTEIRSNKNHYLRWEGRLEFFRWCESEGTVTSSERRIQRVRKALAAPGEARDDIAILGDLGRYIVAAACFCVAALPTRALGRLLRALDLR